jgi:uncharacterized phage protein (TIGR01671 family)
MESIMNRPLKFKVWNKKSNEWCGTIGLNETISHNELEYDTDDLVFVQYTGLTDSKDKEICDGDILKIDYDTFGNVIGQVLYEADHGGYIFQYKRNGPNQHHTNLNCDVAFESVIVGNIFEHSELLK